MFMDIPASGEGGGEPHLPRCKSCRQPIPPGAASERLNFPIDHDPRLAELNGLYHAGCAKPYSSLRRALETLSRPWF